MTIKEIRQQTGLSQVRFAEHYGIPRRTLEAWESGNREPAEYLLTLLQRAVGEDFKGGDVMERNYVIEGTEYDLYQAASGDWCVSVDSREGEREDYNLGTREAALEFILSDYECK